MTGGAEMTRRAIRIGVAMLSLATAALVSDSGAASAQSAKLEHVRISRIPIAPFVPADLALARGWFKDAGLDVTVDAVAGGAVTMQALISNSLDLIYTSLDAAIKARAAGFDVVIVSNNNTAQLTPPDAAALIVRKDAGIANLRQLEGKRVLVNNILNVNWAYTREAIAKDGGDPNKVQFLELPFPEMDDAVLSGRADAASGTEPFTTIGIGTGKLVVLSYMFVEVQPGLNIAGWVARERWVKEHGQAIAAFRGVLQKSIDLLNANPEERTKAILQFTPLKEPLMRGFLRPAVILEGVIVGVDGDK